MDNEKTREVIYKGKKYLFDGTDWVGPDYLVAPKEVAHYLNAEIKKDTSHHAAQLINEYSAYKLMRYAQETLKIDDYKFALQLIQKGLKVEPGDKYLPSLLCKTYRLMGQPDKAINETQKYLTPSSLGLRSTRARVYIDLQEWKKAKAEIAPVLASGSEQNKSIAFEIVRLIKANKPDLYYK